MPPSFFSLDDLAKSPLELDRGALVVRAWSKSAKQLGAGLVHFGVVQTGRATLKRNRQELLIPSEHYFRTSGPSNISGGLGLLISMATAQERSLKIGEIPQRGYLEYKPGGRMAAICPPDVRGDPNLNMLEMDPTIRDQDDHFHPSVRVNIVITGSVTCFTHNAPPRELFPGDVIVLHPKQHHRFVAGDQGMRFVAFHPDSNYGPTRDDNPMLNNTFY